MFILDEWNQHVVRMKMISLLRISIVHIFLLNWPDQHLLVSPTHRGTTTPVDSVHVHKNFINVTYD